MAYTGIVRGKTSQYRELDTRIQQLNWNTELKNG